MELSVEKSYGEKKVHFIHVDVSDYRQTAGKCQTRRETESGTIDKNFNGFSNQYRGHLCN